MRRHKVFGSGRLRWLTNLSGLWLLVGLNAHALAHPFHISTAEMEFNRTTQRFEVSLKVHAIDIEQALTRLAQRKVNLDKDSQAERLLTEYLTQHFYFEPIGITPRQPTASADAPPEKRSTIHYVGRELETTWLWIYFEVELPPTTTFANGQLKLVNSVLLDVTEGQINTVAVRQGAKKHALRMTVKQAWTEFSKEWFSTAAAAVQP